MEVSTPMFMIGYKDTENNKENIIQKHIAIEILLNMIIGKSSDLYQELYEKGTLLSQPDLDYEWSSQYAHIMISGFSKEPKLVKQKIDETIQKMKENGLDEEHFNRIKKKIYGDYVIEYNSVADIGRMFLADSMKGINSFDYIEEFETVTKQYAETVLKDIFKEENEAVSIIEPNE